MARFGWIELMTFVGKSDKKEEFKVIRKKLHFSECAPKVQNYSEKVQFIFGITWFGARQCGYRRWRWGCRLT